MAWLSDSPFRNNGARIRNAASEPGSPEEFRSFKTKVALALEMVAHQRRIGMRFSWVGADGFYGNDPGFVRGPEARGEVFVADVHCDQRIFLADPKPTVKEKKGRGGRKPTKLEANAPAIRVDQWQSEHPKEAWQRIRIRESTRGELEVEVLHRRVWLWDHQESEAHRLPERRKAATGDRVWATAIAEAQVLVLGHSRSSMPVGSC